MERNIEKIDIITIQEMKRILNNIPFLYEKFEYVISVVPKYKNSEFYSAYSFISIIGDSLEKSNLEFITTELNTNYCFVFNCEFQSKNKNKIILKELLDNIYIIRNTLDKKGYYNSYKDFNIKVMLDTIEFDYELNIINSNDKVYLENRDCGKIDYENKELEGFYTDEQLEIYYNQTINSIYFKCDLKDVVDKLDKCK